MKKSYNRQQKEYMEAKALLETLEEEEKAAEQKFIIENNIKNPDGSIPTRTWAIDDDELAEKAIEESALLLMNPAWAIRLPPHA